MGAVINESMNAGCVVIANQEMGAVPFLINHKENGLMYNTYKEFENNVKLVIEDEMLRRKLAKNAYSFITEKWTSKIAANNLLELFESVVYGKDFKVDSGPASKVDNYKKIKNI